MSWIIVVVMTLTFPWVWSRWFSSWEAWENDKIDYTVGMIAAAAWIANTLDIMYTPNFSAQLASDYQVLGAVGLFLVIVLHLFIWVGLTWLFIRLRVWIGERNA